MEIIPANEAHLDSLVSLNIEVQNLHINFEPSIFKAPDREESKAFFRNILTDMCQTSWLLDFDPCEGSEPSQGSYYSIPKIKSFYLYKKGKASEWISTKFVSISSSRTTGTKGRNDLPWPNLSFDLARWRNHRRLGDELGG